VSVQQLQIGLNRAAFQTAKAGTQGTLGRNSIPGFAMGQVDLALRREFRWKDSKVIQVRLKPSTP
jgi:hypothetical protein